MKILEKYYKQKAKNLSSQRILKEEILNKN